MHPMPSIEAFRHVVAGVNKYCHAKAQPLPTIEFVGTVKLHGTNAGVRVTPELVQPQKKTDVVTIGADNAGFAVFCHGKDELFRELTRGHGPHDITLYGEWCGGNIQKGAVALTQLPKHFVIFGAYDATTDKHIRVHMLNLLYPIKRYNDAGIWFISQIPYYEITVDFTKPELALPLLDKYTLEVEKECPWAKFHGVSGTGEGIVWCPVNPDLNVTGLWFKTKGLEHKRTNVDTGHRTEASPEKMATIRELVDVCLPEWRLEQGITALREQGLAIEPKNTGAYLQWISKDVLKEESDRLAENQMEWKYFVKYLMPQARQYYLKKVESEVFGNETEGHTT